MASPCAECPWRLDGPIGQFPPERFRALARCAEDMSPVIFQCHKTSDERPVACAGFLTAGAAHNMAVRMATLKGELEWRDRSAGLMLHPNYRAMAIAQGVPSNDPALAACRDDTRID